MSANQRQMEALTAGLQSKSERIRTLAKAGYKRSDIARFIGSRYQFVRNVLVDDERRKSKHASADTTGTPSAGGKPLKASKVSLGPDGRVVIPAAFRDALGLKEGDTLMASVENGELRMMTIPAAVRRVQAIVRQFVPEGASLVDELLEDRRREAERERKNG
jgi:AbrB family looped-hinge helix DNA binding protein